MDSSQALSFRLESYLLQLSDVNRRWGQWLSGEEAAALTQNVERFDQLQAEATGLFAELQALITDRAKLLDDARLQGFASSDLHSLARSLPAWQHKATLRGSLLAAKQQIANLGRLHIATWVLVHEAAQFFGATLHLLTAGAQPHVYSQRCESDTSVGRLLDASI